MNKFIQSLSPGRILNDAKATLFRFPLVIMAAIAGSLTVIAYEIHDSDELIAFMLIFSLGIVTYFVTATLGERKFGFLRQWVLHVAATGMLVTYYFILPTKPEYPDMMMYLLVMAGMHFLAAFAPYRSGESAGFWQYNKTLFLNFLQAMLYTYVLYAGMCVALLSVDQLLGIDVPDKFYFRLWVVMQGIFNTWFFLAKVPPNLAALNEENDYPGALKIFTQYVLLPIVTVYLAILYAYIFKIVLTWELPNGWVAYLVLGFSVAGIFSLLLLHPVRYNSGNEKLALYAKLFYWALIPPVLLLFCSIGYRLMQYGVTPNRYLVAALAVWLAGVVGIMIKTGGVPIRIIPVGLSIFSFVAALGPFSALNVTGRNQQSRIEALIHRTDSLKFQDLKQLSSSLQQLAEIRQLHRVNHLFPVDSALKADDSKYQLPRVLMEAKGLRYVGEWETETVYNENKKVSVVFSGSEPYVMDVRQYDLIITNYNTSRKFKLDTIDYEYIYDYKTHTCTLLKSKQQVFNFALDTLFASHINRDYPSHIGNITINDDGYETDLETPLANVKLISYYGNLTFEDSLHAPPSYLTARILVKFKE